MKTIFSLVELIITLSVIAILLALMFPVLIKGKAKANRTICQSNLRQIGISLDSYCTYNNNCLPHCESIPSSSDSPTSLVNTLEKGLKRIYFCPSDNAGFYRKYGISYEWNNLLNGKDFSKPELAFGPLKLKIPVVSDAEPFHTNKQKNFLYVDGSVSTELSIEIKE
jgi:prepilin-type processing-associated H-X9-DG protein